MVARVASTWSRLVNILSHVKAAACNIRVFLEAVPYRELPASSSLFILQLPASSFELFFLSFNIIPATGLKKVGVRENLENATTFGIREWDTSSLL